MAEAHDQLSKQVSLSRGCMSTCLQNMIDLDMKWDQPGFSFQVELSESRATFMDPFLWMCFLRQNRHSDSLACLLRIVLQINVYFIVATGMDFLFPKTTWKATPSNYSLNQAKSRIKSWGPNSFFPPYSSTNCSSQMDDVALAIVRICQSWSTMAKSNQVKYSLGVESPFTPCFTSVGISPCTKLTMEIEFSGVKQRIIAYISWMEALSPISTKKASRSLIVSWLLLLMSIEVKRATALKVGQWQSSLLMQLSSLSIMTLVLKYLCNMGASCILQDIIICRIPQHLGLGRLVKSLLITLKVKSDQIMGQPRSTVSRKTQQGHFTLQSGHVGLRPFQSHHDVLYLGRLPELVVVYPLLHHLYLVEDHHLLQQVHVGGAPGQYFDSLHYEHLRRVVVGNLTVEESHVLGAVSGDDVLEGQPVRGPQERPESPELKDVILLYGHVEQKVYLLDYLVGEILPQLLLQLAFLHLLHTSRDHLAESAVVDLRHYGLQRY